MDILQELFYRAEELGAIDFRDVPGWQEGQDALERCCRKIRPLLERETYDELCNAAYNLISIESTASFRYGFQMAVRLFLEPFPTRL